jgi:hypothetical protein
MSRVVEPGICYCACHDPDALIIHCFPCCSPCPTCGRNIDNPYGDHFAACKKRLDDLIKQHERAIETHDRAREDQGGV